MRKGKISVREAALLFGAKVLVLPPITLGSGKKQIEEIRAQAQADALEWNGWESFYAWLVVMGAKEGGPSNLCNRTFAGKELIAKLNRFERQLLKKLNPGISKEQLDKAVWLADLNAAPQERQGDLALTGDCLFFLAEDQV